jgi:hypothetical protein
MWRPYGCLWRAIGVLYRLHSSPSQVACPQNLDLVLAHEEFHLCQATSHLPTTGDNFAEVEPQVSHCKPNSAPLHELVQFGITNSALVGIQPQFRQMPPRASRSISATCIPSCAARIAAT